MTALPPRICACGRVVQARVRCECQVERDRARKARHDQNRPSAAARGYDATWRTKRAEYLKQHSHCRFCGVPATVVDHIRPHRGDQFLFWSRSNWQPLCAPCHNSIKQSREARAR